MITINELKPIKLSGLSSFLVKFQYDANIVAEIKQISGAIYHKKLQA